MKKYTLDPLGIRITPGFKQSLEIKLSEYVLLCLIYAFSKRSGSRTNGFYGGTLYLTNYTGNTDDTVRSDISKLIEKGYLIQQYNLDGKLSYFVTDRFRKYYESKGEEISSISKKRITKTEKTITKTDKTVNKPEKLGEQNPRNSAHNNKYFNDKINSKYNFITSENRSDDHSSNFGKTKINEFLTEIFSANNITHYETADNIIEYILSDIKSQNASDKKRLIEDVNKGLEEELTSLLVFYFEYIEKKYLNDDYIDESIEDYSLEPLPLPELKSCDLEIDSIYEYVEEASTQIWNSLKWPSENIDISKIIARLRSLDDI